MRQKFISHFPGLIPETKNGVFRFTSERIQKSPPDTVIGRVQFVAKTTFLHIF